MHKKIIVEGLRCQGKFYKLKYYKYFSGGEAQIYIEEAYYYQLPLLIKTMYNKPQTKLC